MNEKRLTLDGNPISSPRNLDNDEVDRMILNGSITPTVEHYQALLERVEGEGDGTLLKELEDELDDIGNRLRSLHTTFELHLDQLGDNFKECQGLQNFIEDFFHKDLDDLDEIIGDLPYLEEL